MPTKTIFRTLTLVALLLPPSVQANETNNWSFAIAPYLWIAGVGAEASVPEPSQHLGPGLQGLAPGVLGSVQEFDTRISAGFMVAAEAKYRSVGVAVDFNWLRLDTESLNPGTLYSSVNLRTDFFYNTAALTYDLPFRGKFHAEVQGGVRVWHVSTDFNVESGQLPGFESSSDKTWVNGLVGLSLRYDLTSHWALLGRGTVGGFTNDSIQWDLFAGVGYQFSDWCMATLGYRYLHEDYTKGDYTFNAWANGALVGVVFSF